MTTSSSLADVAVGALTDDPYLDATTGTLRNLLGIQERSELARAEIDLVFRRAATRRSPANPTYDLAHLQAIHQWLFQDVFEWAGNLRRRDIRKGENDVAAASGRVIDWGRVSRSANDAASSRAVQSQSPSSLRRLLEPVIIKLDTSQSRASIATHDLDTIQGALRPDQATRSTTTRTAPRSAPASNGSRVCPLCGRRLWSRQSIERGYGPTCWRKVNG